MLPQTGTRALSRIPRTLSKSNAVPCAAYNLRQVSRRNYADVPRAAETPATKPQDLRSQFGSATASQATQYATQPTPKRSLRPLIYATLFLFFGLSAGQYMRLVISPPPLPPADSREDLLMAEYLQKKGSDLPLVKSLTGDPAWESHDAYASISSERRSRTLTTGPLAGARALGGFQRIFTNKTTGEVITVVWFGGALSGWPGVTHGGLVATIMDEQLGRCAIRQFPSQTGVTANLDINYRKPVLTNSYYVVKAWPQRETFTERKGWVSARLETLDGKVCADAKALYVVPKKYQTQVVGNF